MEDQTNKFFSKDLLGKTVVSKSGKKFGDVGDIVFETKSGELIYIIIENPTPYIAKFELEKNDMGKFLIPFSSVIALGDFIVISEEDII